MLAIKEDGKIDVSLKKSLVLYKPREVKENAVFRAIVKEKREQFFMVTLMGANCKAELKGFHRPVALSEEIWVRVTKIKEGRVHVANKQDDVAPLTDDADERVQAVWESVLDIQKNAMDLEASEASEEGSEEPGAMEEEALEEGSEEALEEGSEEADDFKEDDDVDSDEEDLERIKA